MAKNTRKKIIKKKITKAKTTKNKKLALKAQTSNKINVFQNVGEFLLMIIKFPFVLINSLINIIIVLGTSFFKNLYAFTGKVLLLFSSIKEAIFVLIFGFLAGCIGAVVVFSYLDFSSQNQSIAENIMSENTSLTENLNVMNEKVSLILREQENLKSNLDTLKTLKKQLSEIKQLSDLNNDKASINSQDLKVVMTKTEILNKNLAKLSDDLDKNSKLILSSSKSELSNRLYLAKSLLGRLKSGVPYSPQLIALGKEGLDPALLRFAKGGAPTLSDLAARLSVRAGELKDADKTKRDKNWKNNLKKEITKFVKIKPTNINKISGTPGVLLRAEYAISNGNLDKAIGEIDSLDSQERGVLNAWLAEAKATKNANIAAENLLAKTTAAFQKRN